jgi:hypothetical protein
MTEIINNGASLNILTDGIPNFIMKSQIRDVNVLRDTIIKIDIGQGALNNVFIDQVSVTAPVNTDVNNLRDQIIAMLQTNNAGLATELKQDSEITKITDLATQITDLQTKVGSVDSKLFFEPTIVDENNPNFIYKGFAIAGSKTSDPVWAIEKISSKKGVLSYQWAGGTKNFDKVWDNRAALIFS